MAPPSQPPRIGGALDDVNDGFHAHYAAARETAASDAPVMLVLGDELVTFHRGRRRAMTFAPREFHALKSVAHAPIALYAALERGCDAPLDPATRASVEALAAHCRAAMARMPEPHVADESRTLLARTDALATRALRERSISRAALEEFARSTGPLLLRVTEQATALQLASLHRHVEAALADFDASERAALQVIVAGDHQARVRSLAMQYFRQRLGEREGEERRVAYGEGIEQESDALALVGARRLDRSIATAFFGDARRLQRDVLGDAAAEQLRRADLSPIG